MDWLSRLNAAIDYMEERLSLSLNIDDIAKTAYSSSFHFQRMFSMLTGMTVAEYVRNRIVTLAAQELATSSIKVVDVAMKYGYDSPESFSKAFKRLPRGYLCGRLQLRDLDTYQEEINLILAMKLVRFPIL